MSDPITVTYAPAEQKPIAFQHMLATDLPFEHVLQRLRDAIEEAGFWILHEIDPQALLLRGGYRIRSARQMLFFHPRFVARILGIDPAALIEAPLKIAVVEGPSGRVMLRWFAPDLSFARYDIPELAELGRELAKMCDAIATKAVAKGVPA